MYQKGLQRVLYTGRFYTLAKCLIRYTTNYKTFKIKSMKKLLTIAAIAATFAACNNSANDENADTLVVDQDTAAIVTTTPTYTEGDVIKRDGRAHVYTNGTWVVMDRDVTLDNGVVIKTDGKVVNKEGQEIVWEEGQYVTRTGAFFDRTGAAIENAWDATKRGVGNAAQATKEGLQTAGDSIAAGANRVGDRINEAVR